MASLIISSTAVPAVSRATPSKTSLQVVPFNGLKLSNSAVAQAHASLVAPFTGLKSNSTFPMSRNVNSITSLTSNGGRAKCTVTLVPLSSLKFVQPSSWINTPAAPQFTGGTMTTAYELDVSTLMIGLSYTVYFYVTMEQQHVQNSFALAVVLPDYNITTPPTNAYTVIPTVTSQVEVGTFVNTFMSGTVKFQFDSGDPAAWGGLIIQQVVLVSA